MDGEELAHGMVGAGSVSPKSAGQAGTLGHGLLLLSTSRISSIGKP